MTSQTDDRPLLERVVRPIDTGGVTVRERFTAAEVARRNARIVADALAAAGLAHVEVACPTSLRRVVGLDDVGLVTAAEALAATGLRAVVPGGEEVVLGTTVAAMAASGGERRLWLFDPVADPGGHLVLGASLACELQAWARHGDRLEAPRQTAFGRWLPADVLDAGATELPAPSDGLDFPIDAVYTWVDDADPAWVAQRDQALIAAGRAPTHASNLGDARFRNRDELRYSLRSLAMYAPYVRHVYCSASEFTGQIA